MDSSGNVYVCEIGNDRVKRYKSNGVLDAGWGVNGIIGSEGSHPTEFDDPMGLAVDSSGNLYIADTFNHRVVRYTNTGQLDTSWGGGDGIIGPTGSGHTRLLAPEGVGCDASDNLYVADGHGVRRYTSDGASSDGTLDTTYSGDGIINGMGGAGDDQFISAEDIVVTPAGQLYVMDNNGPIQRVLRYTDAGLLDTSWGGGDAMIGSRGLGAGQFRSVCGGSVDPSGRLYVADFQGWSVERYTETGVLDTSWCGDGVMGTTGSEPDQFNIPGGTAADTNGNVYVADAQNHRVVRYTSSGTVDTSWGGGDGVIGNLKGSGIDQFDFPMDVAIDAQNRLYITDNGNHRIARYTSGGLLDTSWATGGMIVELDGNGPLENRSLIGITVSDDGYIYASDNTLHRIKRYTPSGDLDTTWCSGGILGGTQGSGIGEFDEPLGLATDALGNLYIADTKNHRVMRYTASGVLDTSWGGGDGIIGGTLGSGIDQLSSPRDVVVNPLTNELYIADYGNERTMCYDSDGASPECIWEDTLKPETHESFGTLVTGLAFSQGSLYTPFSFQNYVRELYDVENGLKLTELTVSGSAVPSFDPNTLAYTIIVPKGATQVTIAADTFYTTSSVSGTGTHALSSANTTDFTLTVTAQNGGTQDYTVTVMRDGEDVGLSSLTMDGNTVFGFAESKTSYTVTAPYGARYIDIGATGNKFCEQITGTGVVKLTGDTTVFSVVAKASDGSAKIYTLTVKKNGMDADWISASIDGKVFDSGGISIVVPEGGKTLSLRITMDDGTYVDLPISLTVQTSTTTPTPKPSTQPTDSPAATETPENIPDTSDTSDDTFTASIDGVEVGSSISVSVPQGGKSVVITIELPNGNTYDIPVELIPEGSVSHNDVGAPYVFAWWWIIIGVMGLGIVGMMIWVVLLKRH